MPPQYQEHMILLFHLQSDGLMLDVLPIIIQAAIPDRPEHGMIWGTAITSVQSIFHQQMISYNDDYLLCCSVRNSLLTERGFDIDTIKWAMNMNIEYEK